MILCSPSQDKINPENSQRVHPRHQCRETGNSRKNWSVAGELPVVRVTVGVSIKCTIDGTIFPHAIVEIEVFGVTADFNSCSDKVTGALHIKTPEKAKRQSEEACVNCKRIICETVVVESTRKPNRTYRTVATAPPSLAFELTSFA